MAEEVFQDEVVRATDLNRGPGEILNKAAKKPVTIVRNDETFALMRRDIAARWRKEASSATHLVELMWHAFAHPTELPPECQWITAFDADQILEMTGELIAAYRQGLRDGNWDEFDAILHEWSESGWAALSPEFQKAIAAGPAENSEQE